MHCLVKVMLGWFESFLHFWPPAKKMQSKICQRYISMAFFFEGPAAWFERAGGEACWELAQPGPVCSLRPCHLVGYNVTHNVITSRMGLCQSIVMSSGGTWQPSVVSCHGVVIICHPSHFMRHKTQHSTHIQGELFQRSEPWPSDRSPSQGGPPSRWSGSNTKHKHTNKHRLIRFKYKT